MDDRNGHREVPAAGWTSSGVPQGSPDDDGELPPLPPPPPVGTHLPEPPVEAGDDAYEAPPPPSDAGALWPSTAPEPERPSGSGFVPSQPESGFEPAPP